MKLFTLFQTGVGKSATGNLLMGQKVFKETDSPVSDEAVIKHKKFKVNHSYFLLFWIWYTTFS